METLNNAEVNRSMNRDELIESFPNERLKDYQSSLRLAQALHPQALHQKLHK